MQLFSNNASSTLLAGISNVATTLQVQVADAAEFSSPSVAGDYELMTITDGTNLEIVKCTGRSSNTLTVARGQEGTSAQSWSSGATIEARLTKAALDKFTQNNSSIIYNLAIGEGSAASEAPAGVPNRANSTNYTLTQVVKITSAITAYAVCVKDGISGSTPPGFGTGATLVQDGQVIWRVFDISSYPENALAIGVGSFSSTAGAIAIGGSAKANYGSLAIGPSSEASGMQSLAIGGTATSRHFGAAVIHDVVSSMENALHLGRLCNLSSYPNWATGLEYRMYTGGASYLQSEPMDLTGGSTWAATTNYKHGYVVKPTVPNGKQYLRWCYNYDAWDIPDLTLYTSGVSGSTEPAWPNTFGDYVSDGDGDWICIPHDGSYVLALPPGSFMLVEEIGFIAYEASGITVQPTISIGTTGNLTKIASAQTTSGLTGNMTAWKYVPSQPLLVPDLTIKIDTLATGTKLLGRFHFKGVLTKHWL